MEGIRRCRTRDDLAIRCHVVRERPGQTSWPRGWGIDHVLRGAAPRIDVSVDRCRTREVVEGPTAAEAPARVMERLGLGPMRCSTNPGWCSGG